MIEVTQMKGLNKNVGQYSLLRSHLSRSRFNRINMILNGTEDNIVKNAMKDDLRVLMRFGCSK